MKKVSKLASGIMNTSAFKMLLKRLPVLLFLIVLSGCASKVTVVSDIPVPLVERVPLNVHLSYTDEFKNHVYIEKEKKRALSSLDLAQAQRDLFEVIFSGLTTLVDEDAIDKDITIEPEILSFEYTAPRETSLKQYEVSIKYRLKLLNKDGSKLADWIVKGYGKTPTALLTSATNAFNSAANVALRDVGAQLATQFPGQQKIKALIDKKPRVGFKNTASTNVIESDSIESPEASLGSAEQKIEEGG